MTYDPFEEAKERVQRSEQQTGLGIAEVTASPANGGHVVVVKELTQRGRGEGDDTGPVPVPVLTQRRGDVGVPAEGDVVVLGYFKSRRPVVLGTLYTRDAAVEYESGERRLYGPSGVFMDGPFGVVPRVDEDPQDAPDGAVWYRSDLGEYRGIEDETTVRFDTTAV